MLVLLATFLPIPVRSQALVGRDLSSGTPVLFPSSTASCVTCKPAFASPACQEILHAIAQSSIRPISNATLATCQCSETFLALYDTCVQCFKETDQLKEVFGSNRAPSLSSLEVYCESKVPEPIMTTVIAGTTTIKTSPTSTLTETPTPTNPSSATALKAYHEGESVNAVMMCMIVAAMTLAYFSILA